MHLVLNRASCGISADSDGIIGSTLLDLARGPSGANHRQEVEHVATWARGSNSRTACTTHLCARENIRYKSIDAAIAPKVAFGKLKNGSGWNSVESTLSPAFQTGGASMITQCFGRLVFLQDCVGVLRYSIMQHRQVDVSPHGLALRFLAACQTCFYRPPFRW